MKIHIEIDNDIDDTEITIRCKELGNDVKRIENALSNIDDNTKYIFYKGDCEYYLQIDSILFFESQNGKVFAHSANDAYTVRMKLYELEQTLPRSFMRISKSAIINSKLIYSIEKNLASSSLASFKGTHKSIYISRNYYKALKDKLNEERLKNER